MAEASGRKSWVFQANPRMYEVRRALEDGVREFTWAVKQFRDEIHSGDRVFLWESGTSGGLWAEGALTSSPEHMEDLPHEAGYYVGDNRRGLELRVRLTLSVVRNDPLGRQAIVEEALLRDMHLMRMSQGTNFRLSDSEADLLSRLVRPEASFRATMELYQSENVVFQSIERGAHFRVMSVDEAGCQVERLSANEPARVMFDLYSVKAGELPLEGTPPTEFHSTSAVRASMLQGPDLGLSDNRSLILPTRSTIGRLENLCGHLRGLNVDVSEGGPRLYKPAMLAAAVELVEEGKIVQNQLHFEELLPRFLSRLKELGVDAGAQQGALAYYHLSGDLFWLLAYKDGSELVDPHGGVSIRSIQERINYALLKPAFFELLLRQTHRSRAQREISRRWWPDRRTHSNRPKRYWWVNQGKTFREEREGSLIWAPKANEGGQTWGFWTNVSAVSPGDVVLSYSRGFLRAVSLAESAGFTAQKPTSIRSTEWEPEGWQVDLAYHDLDNPVPLSEVTDLTTLRSVEGGPLDSNGSVKQGYLFALSTEAAMDVLSCINPSDIPTWLTLREEHPQLPVPDSLPADTKFWTIGLGEGGRLWGQCKEERIAAIGWDFLGDMGLLEQLEDFERAVDEHYADGLRHVNNARACFDFTHTVSEGDILIVKKGRSEILALGIVRSGYSLDATRAEYKSIRRV